jgi:hypothetical protein
LRLLPNIRYGTERFPETIARRRRALNFTAWIAALLGAGFAVTQLLDPAPGLWKPGVVPRDTGLKTAVMTFASFIITTIASCATLFMIVLYGVREAEREHARSESLLANILPATIVSRLKRRAESVVADRYDAASILFADMAGFTARTSDTRPRRPGAVSQRRLYQFRSAG